jgi:penicillin amidase
VIRDGTTRSTDWLGFLPVARWPYARNPSQGFLASANQEPLDPDADPTYFGSNWPSPWRAIRINALLGADTAVTSEAMSRYQNDPGSARADWFVPAFIAAGQRAGGTAGGAADLLARWDRRYTHDNEYAILFELAMGALRRAVWDELDLGEGRRAWAPGDPYLAALLADSAHPWWDVRATSRVETRDNVLATSLAAALDTAVARYGQQGGGWRWDQINRANVWHLLRLPALSTRGVPVQGGPGLLNPVSGSGTHGPSWRMVVEMSAARRAWSIYPGGQSGNPLSARYADRIPAWADGRLEEVRLPRRPEELPPEHRAQP